MRDPHTKSILPAIMDSPSFPIPIAPTVFDQFKSYTKQGVEYWHARKLQRLLAYGSWQNFEGIIQKAVIACEQGGASPKVHFNETVEVKEKSNSASTQRKDYHLTKHACYLIAMNADGTKQEVAEAMTYFSIQTQRQEISDQWARDAKRIEWRGHLTDRQKRLHSAAKNAGVQNYALFNDAGYRGLYRMHLSDLLRHKKLPPSAQLFDHIGTTELAANAFRATQAAEILQRKNIRGQNAANDTHEKVGTEVRQTIQRLGNTMPENLPTEPNIKVIARRLAKSTKRLEDKAACQKQIQ